MYLQVAVLFADLHDTPGRMKEKGVISVSHLLMIKIIIKGVTPIGCIAVENIKKIFLLAFEKTTL